MLPLYLACVKDLGWGDLVKVLRRLPSRRIPDAGGAGEVRAEARREGSRSQRAVPVPPMLEEGARFDREKAQADVNPGPMRHTERGWPELEWRADTGRYSAPDVVR